MEAKKAKNFKELEQVMNRCEEKSDTLFAIYSATGGKCCDNSAILFTGDEKCIAYGFAELIKESTKEGKYLNENARKISNAFLNAISMVLSKKDKTSKQFANVLLNCIEHAEMVHTQQQIERFQEQVKRVFDEIISKNASNQKKQK